MISKAFENGIVRRRKSRNGGKWQVVKEEGGDLRNLARYIPGGLFRCEARMPLRLLQVSSGFLSMLGFTQEDLERIFQGSFWQMIDPRDRERIVREVARQMSEGDTKEIEYRIFRKTGDPIWVLDKGRLVRDNDGKESFYCLLVDITEARKAQEELRMTLERHQIIMNQTNDIIFEWDLIQDTCSFSANWWKKFGYDPIAEHVTERIPDSPHLHREDAPIVRSIIRNIHEGNAYQEGEVRIQKADGNYLWCRIRITGQRDDFGNFRKAVGVIQDIDTEKTEAQQLMRIAEQDTLTGLYNKGAVQKRIVSVLHEDGTRVRSALLMIDVDNFKQINDTMGHLFGDAFLREISGEIRKIFRTSDIVGRVGGDEFLAFLRNITGREAAIRKAREILRVLACAAKRMNLTWEVSCSIGIAIFPRHGQAFQELYLHADNALYHAKQLGKNRFVIYDGEPSAFLPADCTCRSRVSTQIDSDGREMLDSGKLAEMIFCLLYRAKNVQQAISSVLQIVGKQFEVSRVYVFEDEGDGRACSMTYEWCAEGVSPTPAELRRHVYAAERGIRYLSRFNEEDIFYCQNSRELPEEEQELLRKGAIASTLQCAIRENGGFRGCVGFDECGSGRFWTRAQIDALIFLAEVLSAFLMKQRAQEQAIQAMEAMQSVLDSQTGSIYVIRPKTYDILYANKKALLQNPEQNEASFCYQILMNEDQPCKDCPARLLNNGREHIVKEIFNPRTGRRFTSEACCISWKGEEAVMLSCRDIPSPMA